MINWAWRQWLFQPARLILTLVVFAGVLALAMLFDGIRIGIVADMREFPASLEADLVAITKGNSYFAMAPSSLPATVLPEVAGVPEISRAVPIALAPFILDLNGQRTPAMLLAYENIGGPKNFSAGREPTRSLEIVLDTNLAKLNGLRVGDTIEVLGSELTISGLSTGTTSSFYPYSFVTYDSFAQIIGDLAAKNSASTAPSDTTAPQTRQNGLMPTGTSLISALLIKTDEGANLKDLRSNLEQAVPEADFFTPGELGDADAAFGYRLLGPVLILLTAMTWLITLLTMAMLRQAEVQANLHQFGIQKALGAKPAKLALALAFGGVLIALSALPLALLIAKGFGIVLSEWNPLWGARVWDIEVVSRAVTISLVAAIAGSLLPWRRLIRLEPVMVFKR